MSEQQEELRGGLRMTDETTARDRAIEGLARRIESQALISDRPGQLDELEQIAREVRALAGAPTADVAALRKRIADTLHMGLDDASPNDPMADDDDHESWVARVQEWADWIHDQYTPLLAAAAEGVDAADERFPRVAGRCPSCRGASSLFLGAGGHVTCSRLDCPDPGVVDDQLHAVSEELT